MLREFFIAAALVLLMSTSALAQTHPCDQPAPTSVVIQAGAPHKVLFCAKPSENPAGVFAWVDGAAFELQFAARSAVSASGWVLYETSVFLQVSRGNHLLELAVANRNVITGALQWSDKTALPFGAADDNPAPGPPAIKGIVR